MIVRAGGLALSVPDRMPADVAPLVERLKVSAIAETPIDSRPLEVAVFGTKGARLLLKAGRQHRVTALHAVMRQWGATGWPTNHPRRTA